MKGKFFNRLCASETCTNESGDEREVSRSGDVPRTARSPRKYETSMQEVVDSSHTNSKDLKKNKELSHPLETARTAFGFPHQTSCQQGFGGVARGGSLDLRPASFGGPPYTPVYRYPFVYISSAQCYTEKIITISETPAGE